MCEHLVIPPYRVRISQKAMALAAATFNESTLCAMGIITVWSQESMVLWNRPSPSVHNTMASLSAVAISGSSSAMESSRNAMATVVKPRRRSSGTPSPAHSRVEPMRVHGT